MDVVVAGFASRVRVDVPLVDGVLLPALREVQARGADPGRRQFVFLVAPPATGKSTLAAVLRARAGQAGLEVGAVGIDGFHLPNRALRQRHVVRGGQRVALSAIKGAPETYDVASLDRYLELGACRVLRWPVYDRRVHDVVPHGERVAEPLVVVEGNWLLLDEPGWRDLARHAALCLFVDADPGLLVDRLVERKVRGGMDPRAAREFVARSDMSNVHRVLQGSDRGRVDLMLRLNPDGTICEGESR